VLQGYVQELFDLLMRSLPRPEEGDLRTEIDATPYESDRWIIGRIAEFTAHVNLVETARKFYRPVLELGPAGRYWVEDFLRSWTTAGVQASPDLQAMPKSGETWLCTQKARLATGQGQATGAVQKD
jgi:hypothetical protein